MKQTIINFMKKDWSPEQITGRFRMENKKIPCHQTIYNWLWDDKKRGGSLYTLLRRHHRYQHGRKTSANHLPNRRMIDERPSIVDERSRQGDWEIDTILSGRGDNTVLITMVDRMSRYLVTQISPTRKAGVMRRKICEMINKSGVNVLTITSDNGTEFAEHEKIAKRLKVDFYFARAHHPWERGTNENTNGLMRQYVPTGTILKKAKKKIQEGVSKINNRPRKVLGYRTPKEVFFDYMDPFLTGHKENGAKAAPPPNPRPAPPELLGRSGMVGSAIGVNQQQK